MASRATGNLLLKAAAVAALATWAQVGAAGSMEGAPPPFGTRDGTAIAIDMESVHIDYTFDYAARRATAHAVVRFTTEADGLPMLDLVPNPTALKLDGEALDASLLTLTSDPHQATRLRVLRRAVTAGAEHVLEIDYALGSDTVTFTGGAVRAGFFMGDLAVGGRQFFEQFGPANFEFDQVAYSFGVRLSGVSAEHEIFTNGELEAVGDAEWTVTFPDYFTTSSPYFHISEKGRFAVQRFDYEGLAATVPVTVYSASSSLTQSGVSKTRSVLRELETTYGPTAHARFVVYLTSSGGGMEHCGATMTSLSALGHELTHSWFARGVMPANGNAGWIDEAIASWRDNGYPRASSGPSRSPVNLGGFSAYRRHTTQDAYSLGARLISEFDYLFRGDGGMKSVLRKLFAERQRTTITVGFFKTFLEETTGQSLGAIFDRYVYGKSTVSGFSTVAPERLAPVDTSRHPRPFTPAELQSLR